MNGQLPLPGPDFDVLLTRPVPHDAPPPRRRMPALGITQLDFFAYFPGSGEWPPAELERDIRTAQQSVWIVCPWFTDVGLARAFTIARAAEKVLIVGDADSGRRASLALCQVAADPDIGVYRVGSADALMHRKRITIDDRVAWFGSANPTHGARRNHEELWRQTGGADIYREQNEYLRQIGRRLGAA